MLVFGPSCIAGTLDFSIDPLVDTFLTFESVMLRTAVSNGTPTRLPIRTMIFANGFLEVEVLDVASAKKIQTRGAEVEYLPGTVENYNGRYITPGETIEGRLNLSHVATALDTLTRFWYWPSGHYSATFRWYYDPWRRTTVNNTGYLIDSIDFIVREPSGEDMDALNRLMLATRALNEEQRTIASIYHNERTIDDPISASTSAREDFVRSCWNIAAMYPKSPYAGEALSLIDFMVSSRMRLPGDVTMAEFAKRFALMAPERLAARIRLESTASSLDGKARRLFLRDVRDSVPGTMVGKAASQLLSKQNDEAEP
jgi:hypothetical protein